MTLRKIDKDMIDPSFKQEIIEETSNQINVLTEKVDIHKTEKATTTTLGHVMVDGETITIDGDGKISSNGGIPNTVTEHINNQQIHVTQAKQDKWDNSSILAYREYLGGAVNFDTVTKAGFYHVADIDEGASTNAPPVGDWSILKVVASNATDSSYIEQEITSVSSGGGSTYFRIRTETTWSPWRKRLDDRDILQQPEFTLTLQNGWTGNLKCYKDTLGRVHISGTPYGGVTTSNVILTTLPVGYRPSSTTYFNVYTEATIDNGKSTLLLIGSDGRIQIRGTALNYIYINASFRG